MNEEFLVTVRHQRTVITSLFFVHTARRSIRLDVMSSLTDAAGPRVQLRKLRKILHLEEREVVTR